MAISPNDQQAVLYDTLFYDDAVSCQANLAADLIGSDNLERAFNYFVQQGLSPVQSAAIVGNLVQESGVDPNSVQKGGPGHGIAQWSEPGRWDSLLKFAQSQNASPTDLGLQLEFVWHELQTGYIGVLNQLKPLTDIAAATQLISSQYEIAGTPNLPNRIANAQKVLVLYGGALTTATTVSTTAGSCSGLTGPGQNTQYIDGFTVYSQYDPAWANNVYGNTTIAAAGCGPSAMAMIITALTGTQVTPAQTAAYANTQNLYVPGVGSSWQIAPVLAAHWSLQSKFIGANIAAITATLQAGGLVIASGQGPLPFTSAGHYIVIRGVAADGKFEIGDSAHADTSSQEWDPQQLLVSMNSGSVYAISK